MKLIQHLSQMNCSSQNAACIRDLLIDRGITPSVGQVRKALKTLITAQTRVNDSFNCPICPDNQSSSATHDQAYHDELQLALNNLRTAVEQIH